jgi:hypothetical protein
MVKLYIDLFIYVFDEGRNIDKKLPLRIVVHCSVSVETALAIFSDKT